MATDFDNLYVTYIDVDGDLLKIWGQRNRIGATYIERQLLQMLPEFNRTTSPDPSRIHKGMFCFAKYTDDNFYRARVISEVQGDSVGVLFVDYGNRDFIKISNVRIQQSNDEVLTKMSEQAEEYYLARVMSPQFGWTKEVISSIRREICYDEFRSRVVAQICDQKIVEIEFLNEDFSGYLVKKQLARPLQLAEQKEMIFSYSNLVSKSEALKEKINFSTSIPPPNLASFKPQNSVAEPNTFHYNRASHPVNFSNPPPPIHYPPSRQVSPALHQMDKNIPKNSFYPHGASLTNPVPMNPMSLVNTVMSPLLNNHSVYQMKSDTMPQFNNMIEILAQQVKQYIAQDNAKSAVEENKELHHFVNSVLEVGSNYNVFISHIDDGPWSFSVQLVSIETELQKLMEELSSTKLIPLKPPLILGYPCIASSKLYGNLCRGVVVSISHSSVKIYFVDFGNTEDLPSSSIYELPTKFFKYRVLSQKFSLSGLERVTYSDDIKKFFKEVVQDELLMLRVTSLKGDNLPTCELYFKDKNIKRILNEKIRELRSLIKDNFPKVGDVEDVVVTWIVSPQKFFVQLHKRDQELNDLKKELLEVEKKGQKIPSHQLAVGLKCVCRYDSDGRWYRTVITNIDSEKEISVFYVDYGNTEKVNVSSLRKIDGPCLINQLNAQAIQCSLKGFENKTLNEQMYKKLEELILEKDLKMKVVSSEKELLCVQLSDGENNISFSLLNKASPKSDSKGFPSPMNGNDKVSPVNTYTNQSEKSQWEIRVANSYRPEGRNFQNGKNRGKTDGRKHGEFKSKDNDCRSINQQPIKRAEDVENARGDKPILNRVKNEKENYKSNQKSGRTASDSSKENGSRGLRQDRGNCEGRKADNFEERKPFDGDKGNRRFDENRKFEKKQDSSERSNNEDNKKFGSAGDRSNRKLDHPKSTRKSIRQEDIAPPGSRFEEKSIKIGSCERCIVTYYFNPTEFYIQLLNQEEEFKKMMQDIQIYYSDKYSLRNPVQAGDIVIAEFSLDKILYRAEVIRPTPVTVRYVDYGNRELVPPKGTWAVDKQFLKLPEQVVQCRLSNIEPIGSYWPPPGSAVDKFFEKEEYKCTFVGFENGVYDVILKAVGSETDVAAEIIAAGLAQSKPAATVDVPKIDHNLLPGQALRLYVTHVVTSSKFYVITDLHRAGVVDGAVKTYVESQKVLTPLEKSALKPGTSCLTTFDDNSWCRGIITKVNEDTVSIWFADRGDDIEVASEKVKILPGHLAEIEPQVAECSLDGISAIEDEEFSRTVEYKHHLLSIVSAIDSKLSVVLYNEDGKKSEFQKNTSHQVAIEPIGELPILYQQLPLVVSEVESANQIYIQRSCDWNDLNALTDQLSEFYIGEKEGFDFEDNDYLVAAKSIEFELWYRGQVMSSSDDGFEVFYIDYGNREILPRDNLKKLDSSFLSFPRFAKKVSLDLEVNEEAAEEIKDKLSAITLDQELFGNFVRKERELICELFLGEEKISDKLKMEPVALNEDEKLNRPSVTREETAPPVEELSQNPVPQNEESDTKVFISHIDSPKQFWVHKESRMNDLHQLQDELQKIGDTLPDKKSLSVGDLVAVTFSGTWYRGKVITVDDDNLSVQFIDYGKTIVVDATENTVRGLTPELSAVPTFATCYALKGNWDANATSKFEEIILSSEDPVTVVLLEDGDNTSVDLLQNGRSICEKLTEEGVACEESESDLATVCLTHINSPSDFYVQRVAFAEVLRTINERLSEAGSLKSPSEVKENEIYVARFPENGVLHRAKIIEKHPNECKVHFIDYGNISNVVEIRELPGGLTDIPGLAHHCSLTVGKTFDAWSEAACEKFAEYADGRQFQMKVVNGRFKKSIVTLFYEGKNVTEELGELCENDGRSEVYVSYAISLTEFYIQHVNDEEYDAIASMLNDADEFEELVDGEPGTLCVARFTNDECWYRAKILKNLNEGCEVLFIDFGNVSVASELKKIPPEIKEIPPKALKCSFDLSDANIPENVKEEFTDMIFDSSFIFRAKIVTPGDVNVVSLKLDGLILEETLKEVYASVCEGTTDSVEGTDDDKNSKLQNNYLNPKDDEVTGDSVANETDEEKRVKIGITGGEEGFKCDDEKGSEALFGIVNATDNEWIEPDVSETHEEASETNEPKNETETHAEDESRKKFVRDKTRKIVPGSICRGEEEALESDSPETAWSKLKHSEKVVPGSISRGISLERAPNGEEEEEPAIRRTSQSEPSTPKCSRRQGYVKTSPNDRLVPGCISRGFPLEVNPSVEKVPSSEKILPGAVNGSTADE